MPVLAAACLAVLAVARGMAADPNALWHIVGEQCVPDEKCITHLAPVKWSISSAVMRC